MPPPTYPPKKPPRPTPPPIPPEPPPPTLPPTLPPTPEADLEPSREPRAPLITAQDLLMLPHSDMRQRWIDLLTQAELDRQYYRYDMALARQFAVSGVLDDIRGPDLATKTAQVFLKIRTGRDMGFSPTQSIKFVYFVNGRPEVQNEIFASKLRQAGYAWDIHNEFSIDGQCIRVTVFLKQWKQGKYEPVAIEAGPDAGKIVSSSFGHAEASRIKIKDRNGNVRLLIEKENYANYRQDMFYWRALSRLRRQYIPEIMDGIRIREEREDILEDDTTSQIETPPAPRDWKREIITDREKRVAEREPPAESEDLASSPD